MQQKPKFIILITLICFIFLLFFPVKVWGVNSQLTGGGGGSCVKQCKTMWYYDDPYTAINPQRHYYCKEYYPLPPECAGTTTPTKEEKEKDKWCCNNSTAECYECSKTGAWSTEAQCKAHCPSGTYLHCRPSLLTGKGSYCKPATWYIVNPGDECKKDADCQNGGTPPPPPPATPKYSCNTSTWTCSQNLNGVYSSLATCQSNCPRPSAGGSPPPGSPPPVSPPPVSPPPVSPPPVSPPPTVPETEPCWIFYLDLPARAWVGYSITGRWSASADCDDCDVDCTSYPECVWKLNNIGIVNIGANEYKFTLSQSGTYDYTLTCYGQGGTDKRTETATVEALNLPWWREIIPVLPKDLQGFLRGIWE